MKFEIRHAANGDILRVEDDEPDESPEEVVDPKTKVGPSMCGLEQVRDYHVLSA